MSASTMPPAKRPSKKRGYGYCLHCVLGLLLITCFGLLPAPPPITPLGMRVLGVFLGMIYLWSFVSILWPSLLGIVALGLIGYAPLPVILKTAFGDLVPILMLFAMILFGAIQHFGISKYISRWFLTRKIINGRPFMFSFVFIYATYVLSALSASILPSLLFMWSVIYSILQDVGYKKGEKYTSLMVIGTLFGAISGQPAKPFTGSALAVVAAFEKTSGLHMDYLQYMLFGFILNSLGIVVYVLLMKYVFRADVSKIEKISSEQFAANKLPPLDARQKILVTSLVGYLVLILLPSVLPRSIGFIDFLSSLGPWGIVIAFVALLSLLHIDGKPVFDFKEIAGKYVIWDVYFLVCMAMVVSSALTSENTGINAFITKAIDPVLGNHSPVSYMLIWSFVSLVVANIANHGVMGMLFMPIVYTFSIKNGASPQGVATLVTFGLHVGMLTAACSPFAAILLGNKEWIEPVDVIKYSLVILVGILALYLLVAPPLVQLIFN